MKILVRNGRVAIRLPIPRGIKVEAYGPGLFVSGSDLERRFDFAFLKARGFCVEPSATCSGAGFIVSWWGSLVGANQWFIVCE